MEQRIKSLIENCDWSAIRKELATWPEPDTAELLINLDGATRALIFKVLPRAYSAEVFSYLETRHKDALLQELSQEETRLLLANLRPDDRTVLLEEMPGQVTQRLLNHLSAEDLREARSLLGYPEESVGRLMTPDYVAVKPHWTIERSLEHIRRKGRDSETINVIYVVDDKWHLLDGLGLRRFILGKTEDTVAEKMDHTVTSISAFEDREEAVRVMQRYDLSVLPVVDSDGVLLGIITVDDVLDVAQEEATEDFHRVGGITPLRSSYRDTSVFQLFSKRIGWLLILILINLTSSGIMAAFEETLSVALVLTFFIPLLIDSGGNTGAQSATLIIRALATGDVTIKQWSKTLIRELGVGVLLGIAMGIGGWCLGYLRGGFEIGLIVGLTMFFIVIITNIVGMALPYLLSRFRLDPAVASSPLITTIADALGLLIYFSIAKLVLKI